jgi:DNA-binding MarR family transcriptional regulator
VGKHSARRPPIIPSAPTASADAVLSAARLLMAVSARSIVSVDESITLPQFRVLVELSTRGALTLSTVAAQLGVSISTARRLIDRLIASGLASQQVSPAARREIVVELTDVGETIVTTVTRQRRAEIAGIIARMPDGHHSNWVAALNTFSEAGGEPVVPVQGGDPADRDQHSAIPPVRQG